MDLFQEKSIKTSRDFRPLADRMRPESLETFFGQAHLVGEGQVLRRIIESDSLVSMILWGPPGTGKTSLARVIAEETEAAFVAISAVTAGVKEVRQIVEQARISQQRGKRTILFIDEIHRFNKSQQDALLHAVEEGTLILIGATTENPSFEVNAPLLSRCRVFVLQPLGEEDLQSILSRALEGDEVIRKAGLEIPEDVKGSLIRISGGDARILLNTLELSVDLASKQKGLTSITLDMVKEAAQKRLPKYDKKGEGHYDTISAFIKSVRGSDPDAAVYWMACMLDAGEDPLFIARRLVILASEDIGNAEPYGLMLANGAFQAVHQVGMPEARIILSQVTTYLASAPKSNAAYLAVNQALDEVRKNGPEPVPLHLRNAPTGLMRELGYGKEYQYAHDHEGGFVEQEYLPSKLKNVIYYHPKEIGREKEIRVRLEQQWAKRRKRDTRSQNASKKSK
ncbi:replication-associated recombination protein A [candidate division KSB1 bacterium]|nr:replication-associated recombination protein A [candidate division KSB1 bacterium]